MKRFLFLTSVVALGLIMGSCNDLKKMAANADDINYWSRGTTYAPTERVFPSASTGRWMRLTAAPPNCATLCSTISGSS